MSRRILFGVSIALVLAVFPLTARAQAVGEAAMTNSTSGAAAAKAGSALGQGLNQINNKLSNQMGNATKAAQPTSPGPNTVEIPESKSAPGAPVRNSSPLVLSIQGAGTNCPADNKAANTAPAEPNGQAQPQSQNASAGDQSFVICNPRSNLNTKPRSRTSTVEVTF